MSPSSAQSEIRLVRLVVLTFVVFSLLGCDGSSSDSSHFTMRSIDDGWQAGIFNASSNFAARCRTPRNSGDRDGTGMDERNFLRSWSHETYLWYDEIEDRNPGDYNDTLAYFDLLKTTATTASGKAKDSYHHAMPTAEWNALAQSGQTLGYGITWAMISSYPPRDLRVAYVEPGSAADLQGIRRGDRVLRVDGEDLVGGNSTAILNEGIWPSEAGDQHELRFASRDDDDHEFNVVLQAAQVSTTPVLRAERLPNRNIGYILFNDHIATAEAQLVNAINDLQGVDELILDIRYNGGGYLAIASQLAYMIAGDGPTQGEVFEQTRFNDKHPSRNPVTGQPLQPIPFLSETQDFSLPAGQSLPALNLNRVFVLTGSGTCSASEAIINGLRGVDVEVVQIGNTTCGKPYGYYPQDNCAVTYFSIQFEGVNAKGEGAYADGFSPIDALGAVEPRLPGCAANDDFSRDLGDPAEERTAAALAYIGGDTSCGYRANLFSGQSKTGGAPRSSQSAVEAQVIKPAALQGGVLRH